MKKGEKLKQSPSHLVGNGCGCERIKNSSINVAPFIPSGEPAGKFSVAIYFGHTAPPSKDNPTPTPCDEPWGICIVITWGPDSPYDEDAYEPDRLSNPKNGWGISDLVFLEPNHVKFIPKRPFTNENGDVPISEPVKFPREIAKAMGFEVVSLMPGKYQANMREGQFGSVIIPIIGK